MNLSVNYISPNKKLAFNCSSSVPLLVYCFNVSWYPKFIINDIISINVIKKKDIEFEFKCSDNVSFNGILRWGKGAGFSCLRIDFK